MKTTSPVLLPLLRSPVQGDIIAWLFLHPDTPITLTDLAQRVNTSVPTAMREVNRLAKAGLLVEERIGATRHVRPNTTTPLFRPLADLMSVTYGPVPVLSEMLTGVEGVREAFIYGSWAARYTDHPGRVPADLDVLVVGTADPDTLFDIAEAATRRLGREVNIRKVLPRDWDQPNPQDSFLAEVKSRPLVALDLTTALEPTGGVQ